MTEHLRTVEVGLGARAYPVYIGTGILAQPETWAHHLPAGKILLVSNQTVAPLYQQTVINALRPRTIEVLDLPDGEQFKTVQSWQSILDTLIGMGARRDCCLVALGGGVVGDITGYAAASYMRGVSFVQIPTTLLAQVDASVGGKTGINHAQGKNLIGAFHQPRAVVVDTRTQETLPLREYRAGLAEVVKYGAIMDPELLNWIEQSVEAVNARQPAAIAHMVERSVQNKARIVAEDETEAGIRAILNFGHSFGHALESLTGYTQYLHGEAVAIGMVVAARLSEQTESLADGSAARLASLLRQLGLPTSLPQSVSDSAILEALGLDKKATAQGIRLILLREMGQAAIVSNTPAERILQALQDCRNQV